MVGRLSPIIYPHTQFFFSILMRHTDTCKFSYISLCSQNIIFKAFKGEENWPQRERYIYLKAGEGRGREGGRTVQKLYLNMVLC